MAEYPVAIYVDINKLLCGEIGFIWINWFYLIKNKTRKGEISSKIIVFMNFKLPENVLQNQLLRN